jgi:murein DD-endopeptidase MepM/ murein hydrolase activator NlpD
VAAPDSQPPTCVVFPLPVGTCRRTSAFGMRVHPTTQERALHSGVDYGAPEGTPVLAFSAGLVSCVETDSTRLGGFVVIEHDIAGVRVDSLYAHMWPGDIRVRPGDHVAPGQLVGLVGSAGRANGPHLHFELHAGPDRTPTDPEVWVDAHDRWASAAWRVIPTNRRSKRRALRRQLTRTL